MEIMQKACKRYGELMKMSGMKAADAGKLALSTSLGNLMQITIDSRRSSIKFDVKRVGRIKQPRAGALLSRYANSLARDAFEHDLTRRPKAVENTVAVEGIAPVETNEVVQPLSGEVRDV